MSCNGESSGGMIAECPGWPLSLPLHMPQASALLLISTQHAPALQAGCCRLGSSHGSLCATGQQDVSPSGQQHAQVNTAMCK